MKLRLAAAALILGACAHAPLGPSSVEVYAQGRDLGAVAGRAGSEGPELDAARLGRLCGGRANWSQASGALTLTLRGRLLALSDGSSRAVCQGQPCDMGGRLSVSGRRAFAPASFVLSEDFARWCGMDARLDPDGRALRLTARDTVGAPELVEDAGRAGVVVALDPGVSWRASARGAGEVDVTFPFARVAPSSPTAGAGLVRGYAAVQEAGGARLIVKLAAAGAAWRAVELSDPRRLELDAYPRAAAAPPAAELSDAVAAPTSAASQRRLVVVDAGHGGKDPGATGTRGTREKDVTLKAALALAKVLRARGFEVALTRSRDVFVPLSDRSKTANDLDADLFVSLHCNSAKNPHERGFEVYSVSETASDPEAEALAAAENAPLAMEGKKPEDETARQILLAMTKTEMINESAPFAALVEREMAKHLNVADRGAKQAGFYVLRGTHAPAILVELAFLSNSRDEAKLRTEAFRKRAVASVADGVCDYARKKGWRKCR